MNKTRKIAGLSSLFIAIAYLLAMPYFLLVVDYPSVTDPLEKLLMIRDNFTSMYAMHIIVYQFVAVALVVLSLALFRMVESQDSLLPRLMAAFGLIWACLLFGSTMVFNYGMGTAIAVFETDPAAGIWHWQVIESIAQGLGGGGGEFLGGVWMLTLGILGLRVKIFPKTLSILSLVIAAAGLISNVPFLHNAGIVFGLLQIVWFAWAGILLISASHDKKEPA